MQTLIGDSVHLRACLKIRIAAALRQPLSPLPEGTE